MKVIANFIAYTGGSKKSLWNNLEEKCLRKSKMLFDGVFLSMFSHLLKKLELSKLRIKKSDVALKSQKWLILIFF